MLASLVGLALRQRVLVIAIALVVVGLGVNATREASLDVFPEFAPPLVEIQTEAPGLSTEEVENLVTVPLELAVNGVPGLRTLRSKSVLGLSSVVLLFAEGSDPIRARQLVQERVGTVTPRLPLGIRAPVMLPPLSATSRAMKIGLSSPTLDRLALSDHVRWTIRPRLMAVPGVANVAAWGQRDRQLQVLVDPARLAAAGVTLAEVQRAAGDAAVVGGGGFVDTPNQRLAVRHVSAATTPDELARTVVRIAGSAPVRIGDVAEVIEGNAAPIGEAVIDDGPGILLIVEKQQGANTLAVTRGVEAALDALRPALGDVRVDPTIFRPATFIERALANLAQALWLGCALVALVLVAFTRDWRAALISLTAIPLSLLGAALALAWLDAPLNTMVIAGLVIALGEVVDDAIIDVENVGRRLRQNRALAAPRSAFAVVLDASVEVRGAVVYASLIVILVFLPVFFLDGVSGSFFRPLATAYVLAIGASLLVALTVTPALCLWLLPRDVAAPEEPRHVRRLRAAYAAFLPRVLARPGRMAVVAAAGIALAGLGYGMARTQFLPDFRETDFLMHFVAKPGASVESMERIVTRASRDLRAIPGVRNFGAHIGRAEMGDEVYGPNFTELWISLDESADYDASVARIQTAIDGYPGLTRDVLTYLRERIKEVLTGAGATLVLRIYGPELDGLRDYAGQLRAALANVPGAVDLKVEQQTLVPQITVKPDAAALAVAGLTPGEVRRAASTLVGGTTVGQVFREATSLDVAVWSVPAARADVAALRNLLLVTPAGLPVRLSDVARVAVEPAANEIRRENGARRIDVTLNVRGASLDAVAASVNDRLAALPAAAGYHVELLGEYAALRDSRQRLTLLGAVSLAGILLLVWLEFRSLRLTALVAASLPFALVGAVAVLHLTGGVLSLGSLVGFVTVNGIAARNGILLLSHFRHLEQVEGMAFGPALVIRGAAERLAPILMTAGCAALALLPLAVRGDLPGHEIEHPMALVILGGLVSSTLLNLVVVPALYLRYGATRQPTDANANAGARP